MLVVTGALETGAEKEPAPRPLVQLALLLDTSGSMSGMINQAKTQLWSIVNEFATAKRGGLRPILQVALYHYGTPALGAENGYVRELAPLTDDLDRISEALFDLKTSGGDEYCGWVIRTAADQLKWSDDPQDYKAIFIAGNESFSQGKVDYRKACKAAISRGIMINTIHCAGGADAHWEDGARLADGRFMRINANKAIVQINAPQDAELARLNADLNRTYVGYGPAGEELAERQRALDGKSRGISAPNLSQRVAAKASAQYRNVGWDLVDAVKEEAVDLEKMEAESLPEEMREMSREERRKYVETKQKEREAIQAKVRELTEERKQYIAAERRKALGTNKDTLGDSIRTAVREQAGKKSFVFE
jgi:hypothetical protein